MQYVVEPPTLNQYNILYTVEPLKLMWTLYWDLYLLESVLFIQESWGSSVHAYNIILDSLDH